MAPMLATAGRPSSFSGGPEWLYERKVDGLRCVAVRHGGGVELWSRNHRPYHDRFPAVVAAVLALPAQRLVVDGELAVLVEGRTSFSALQSGAGSAVLCCFDLLHLEGTDTTALDIEERKALLAGILDGAPRLPYMGDVAGDPGQLLEAACAAGWEGLVAKRRHSRYRSGRSADWVKLKCTAGQELVVGGWTEPTGHRTGLGALLVGYYSETGALRYAGRVGTGFTQATLAGLLARLRPLERTDPPFVDAEAVRGVHWAEPLLVAEVAFTEWTTDGRLRHPSYKGLREDKDARAVRREHPGGP